MVAPDARSATFTPAVSLAPGTTYIVTVSGIVDLGGLAGYSDEGNQCSGLIVISVPGWCDQSSERSDAGFCIL
jgi:hypothetical protein